MTNQGAAAAGRKLNPLRTLWRDGQGSFGARQARKVGACWSTARSVAAVDARNSGQGVGQVGTGQCDQLSLKCWFALTLYGDDGTIEIDNNATEGVLRGPVLSRKNFLFAGVDSGGKRAPALYRLLETAKLEGLDPEAHLRHVVERIPEHPINRTAELLPWKVRMEPEAFDCLAA